MATQNNKNGLYLLFFALLIGCGGQNGLRNDGAADSRSNPPFILANSTLAGSTPLSLEDAQKLFESMTGIDLPGDGQIMMAETWNEDDERGGRIVLRLSEKKPMDVVSKYAAQNDLELKLRSQGDDSHYVNVFDTRDVLEIDELSSSEANYSDFPAGSREAQRAVLGTHMPRREFVLFNDESGLFSFSWSFLNVVDYGIGSEYDNNQ